MSGSMQVKSLHDPPSPSCSKLQTARPKCRIYVCCSAGRRTLRSAPYRVKHSGHYMYRTVATICNAQWPLYAPQSGLVTICTAQWSGHFMYRTVVWSLYVPHSGLVTICTAQCSGHYMYRTVVTICTAPWLLYVTHSALVTICTAQWSLYVLHRGYYMYRPVVWSLYVPPSGHYMYHQFNIHNPTFCPHCVFMCFVWISEQTAIISLHNIN